MNSSSLIRTEPIMGTLGTIHVVNHGEHAHSPAEIENAVERAFDWFRRVESSCSRFDPASELRRLCATAGTPVPVSPLLCEIIRFALAVAAASGGAFDPTLGRPLESLGFDRHYRTGESARASLPPTISDSPSVKPVSYRDVYLDAAPNTVTLLRPLLLDLGAIAKGFAVDLAARELSPFADFAINAGGDLYLAGRNPDHEPWSIGIPHPRREGELLASIRVSGRAVCTSGDYERRSGPGTHHILDPATGTSARLAASVTVVAPSAILADALATAAFVLGPDAGIALLESHGVEGLLVTPALDQFETRGMSSAYQLCIDPLFPHAQRTAHDRPVDSPRLRGAG